MRVLLAVDGADTGAGVLADRDNGGFVGIVEIGARSRGGGKPPGCPLSIEGLVN